MIHQYTPLSELSPTELAELNHRASLTEGVIVLSSGKVIAPGTVQQIRERTNSSQRRQSLFG